MKSVFADTAYWIALLNPKDDLHDEVRRVSDTLGQSRIVTSEFVMVELLNSFAGGGAGARATAVDLGDRLRENPNVDLVPLSSALFRRAVDRYARRKDKAWSLVDCTSFLIMEERGITDALTPDIHFQQAGFEVMLSA